MILGIAASFLSSLNAVNNPFNFIGRINRLDQKVNLLHVSNGYMIIRASHQDENLTNIIFPWEQL